MQNLLNDLTELLSKDDRLVVDGKLLKNKITELALSMNPDLIKLLLKNKSIKKHFFTDIPALSGVEGEGILVFDKIKFQRFVSNKEFLPDSYTAFKNKIGLITEQGDYIINSQEVVLAWPYKDCVLEGGQTKEDQKRDEIFWNETLAPDEIDRLLAPKVFTGWKRYDSKGEHELTGKEKVDFQNANLIIRGNNLLALHSLYKRYAGKVKLIYIDPPYNTGGDNNIFSYNNTFNHSSWLSFMKNRLEIAKTFLANDGFIVIAIDHCELFYLGALADEIFNRENRIAIVTVVHNPKGRNQAKFFSENSEYMLVYANNIQVASFNQVAIDDDVLATFDLEDENGKYRYENYIRARTVWSKENRPKNWYPIYVSKDLKKISSDYHKGYYELYPTTSQGDFAWKNIKKSFDDLNKADYFKAMLEDNKVILYHKYYEQQVLKNVWTDKKYQSEFNGTNLLKKLIGTNKFSYPKSLYAVVDIIKLMTEPGDIVMDFFGGSGTTFHAVFEINETNEGKRSFILIEQLKEHIDIILKRTNTLIANSSENIFYFELMEWNEAYISRIQKSKTTEELLKIWNDMQSKAFISYKIDPKTINENISDFKDLPLEDQKRFLIETLDKNQLYVNYSEIDDKDYQVSETDKKINRAFYGG